MSDEQMLFVVLCLIYFAECCFWLKKQSVAFLSPWYRKWYVKTSNSIFGNVSGSLIWLNPLPPLGHFFKVHLSSAAISLTGICSYNLQTLPNTEGRPQKENSIVYDQIEEVQVRDETIEINQNYFVKCSSHQEAIRLKNFIEAVTKLDFEEREKYVKQFIDDQFCAESISGMIERFKNITDFLVFVCSAYFVVLFVAIPVFVNILGLRVMFVPIATIIFTFTIQILIVYYYSHKELYPNRTKNRVGDIIKMLLCPPAAIRAVDHLTSDLFSMYNPLVVASELSFFDNKSFIKSYMRDLKYPLEHNLKDPLSVEIAQWYTGELLNLCFAYIKENKSEVLGSDEIFSHPQQDHDCNTFCPRCETQSRQSSGICPECPGVELIPYAKDELTNG
ncbi:hypothetical protein ACFL43_02290 [Thermodesulfobacteriota bacterium]